MSACLGECMCLFIIVGDHKCILLCHVTNVNPKEWYEHGCVSMYIGIEWRFQVECFPDALIYKGLWQCSATFCPLRKCSVLPSALTVPHPLSDWTGSKGSLSLSVSILHIDLNDYYTLTTGTPLGGGSLPLPSLLHRLLSCTHRSMPWSTLLKPALDCQELTLSV